MDFIKKLNNSENRMFYIFLLVHLVVWTGISLIRTIMPTDALEGIYWGYLADFGTPKHPPLAGWLSYLAYAPFKSDFCIYFVSQLFIFAGFIYIYRLAKCFLEEKQAMLSVVLLEGCWVYSYITCYYGFNPDVILLFLLPAITFYFYQCVTTNKGIDWVKLGVLVGISFMNKYQTALVIIAMAIWAGIFKRDVYKNKFFYIAVAIAFMLFLPHILWLIKYDFYPLMYFEGELTASSWLNHITAPLMFLIIQIGLIAGVVAMFVISKLAHKSSFALCGIDDKGKTWFLLLLTFVPLIIHLSMGIIEGGTMRSRWGYEFWYMTGIMLFYFFPMEINKKEFSFVIKSAYVVMFIIVLVMGTLLGVEKNYRSRYPVAHVFGDLTKAWQEKCDTPLKYIGGYIEWTLPITIYDKTHPDCIQDNHGYHDPWIKQEDLKKYGVLFMDRKKRELVKHIKKACLYLPDDYKIEPVEYKFFVHNALKMPREYTIYYFIVPPVKEK